jgi:acetolactate synthase I/II/III large subunit
LALRRHGITAVFGQSLPSAFFLTAKKHGIRQITYRTENAGGAMADGYARISNRIAVVGAQNGPAATLLVPPLSEAMRASIPVLALVQEVPLAARDRNAFQELDHTALFHGCCKWMGEITDPARAEDYLDMAIAVATSGRPGPVVLMLPKDVLVKPTAPALRQRHASLGKFPLDRNRPAADQVAEAAARIARASRPLVVAGGGVHLSGASAELARLQEIASLPVATTNMGKGAVSELHELSVGVIGNYMGLNSATRYMRDLVEGADLVLFLGSRTNENGTDSWTLFPADAAYIHADIDSAEIGRNYEALRLPGDLKLVLTDLTEAIAATDLTVRSESRHQVAGHIAAAREKHAREVASLLTSDAVPIRPERVMAELNALLTEDAIVVADASYATIWSGNYLQARRAGQRFLSPRGLAGLGWGLPLALGAKAANPASPVVCISGDGGFAHVWAELETAVREDLPVTLIVLNNSILGFQKHSELHQFGEHTSAIDFMPVDHAAIARACGADAIRVEDPGELRAALKKAFSSPRITLVECLIDPDAYPPITLWDDSRSRILEGENAL